MTNLPTFEADSSEALDALARAIAFGEVEIVSIKVNACRCGGTYESNAHPNWMNRWTCGTCGNHVSK